MPTPLQTLTTQALQLPPEEREALIGQLVASLEPVLTPEWHDEIARRVADMEAGRTQFIPADEALSRLSAHIQARRTAV
jgi:putative addiction module component (TIGR02574 family)